jgi:hypothetical protein
MIILREQHLRWAKVPPNLAPEKGRQSRRVELGRVVQKARGDVLALHV